MTSSKEARDLNRDPITGAPGSHPVGVGVGGVGGAAAGMVLGALGGPIGMLIGGGIGAIAGASAGKGLAEKLDPTGEAGYWRDEYARRPYYDPKYDYDRDYGPAYAYGATARSNLGDRSWDSSTDAELEREWAKARGDSRLEWSDARAAVQDSWGRADRTYRTYEATDRYHQSRFDQAPYRDEGTQYGDYRPAYRLGTQARHQYADREWDDRLESELGERWNNVKGESRLGWDKAKSAAKDAWHSVERALPGDADKDGR
ncbi:hypothetical protein ABIE09_000905 [Lysobacter enzymogenes]|uniref:hypothetical protein n=1 Tax=Lysobacter enzymogenes TaxID=69 RepID=UPI0033937FE8